MRHAPASMRLVKTPLELYIEGWSYELRDQRSYPFGLVVLPLALWNGSSQSQSVLYRAGARKIGNFDHRGLRRAPVQVLFNALDHVLMDARSHGACALAAENVSGSLVDVLQAYEFSQEDGLLYKPLRPLSGNTESPPEQEYLQNL